MIKRFQLGNPCKRNKGTLFSAQIFPTYHQTPIMCYRKPLSLRHSPHTHTFVSIVWDTPGSDRSIMCYRNEFSLGHSSNTNYLFACIVCDETWHRPSIKLSCQSYVIDTLSLNTPYVWESTWFCVFLCVLSQRTVVRTFRQHHTSFRLCFLGKSKNQVQTGPSTSAIKHS